MEESVVKVTPITYCAECHKDYEVNEVCYYTWLENNVFCEKCKSVLNERSKESYLKWELRIANLKK